MRELRYQELPACLPAPPDKTGNLDIAVAVDQKKRLVGFINSFNLGTITDISPICTFFSESGKPGAGTVNISYAR